MMEKLFSPLVVGIGSRAASQIIGLVLVIFASRYLDLAAFGIYSLAWAATVIATSFVFTGFYQAILRSRDLETEVDTMFWLMFAVGALGSVVMLVIALLVGRELSLAMLALAPIPTAVVLVAWNEAQLLAASRARQASIHHMISEIVGLTVVVVSLQADHGLMGLIYGRLAATLSGMILTTAMVRKLPRLHFGGAGAIRAFHTALPLWSSTGVGLFANYGSDIILALFLNPLAVGAYRGGSRIATTASDVLAKPLDMLNWAKFSRLERNGEAERLRDAWRQHAAFSAVLTWPVLIAVMLLAPELTQLLFDDTWKPAAPVISYLALAKALAVFQLLLAPTLVCMGRGALQVKIRGFGAILLLVLLVLLAPYGAGAVAVAHVFTNLVMAVVSVGAMCHTLKIPVRDALAAFAPAAITTVLCATAILVLGHQTVELGSLLGMGTMIAALALLWTTTIALLLRRNVLVLPSP